MSARTRLTYPTVNLSVCRGNVGHLSWGVFFSFPFRLSDVQSLCLDVSLSPRLVIEHSTARGWSYHLSYIL